MKWFTLLLNLVLMPCALATITYADIEQLALTHNLGIKQKSNTLASEKLSTLSSFKRLWFPQLSLELSAFRNEVYQGFTDDRSLIERGERTYLSTLSANYKIFNGFKDYYGHQYNRTRANLAADRLQLQKENLIFNLKKFYYDISHEINQLEITKNVLKRDKELLKTATIRFNKGLIPKSDLKRREIQFLQASDNLEKQTQTIANLRLELEKLIGSTLPPKDSIEPLNYLKLEKELIALIDEIKGKGCEIVSKEFFKDYSAYNHDLQLAAKNITLHQAGHKRAKGDFLPTLSLTALHSYYYTDTESDSLAFGITLSLPLFNSFDTMIKTKQESLALINAKHDYEQTSFEARRELRKLTEQLLIDYNSFKTAQKKLESRQYIQKMMTKRFLAGAVSTKDLIDEEILLQEEKFSLAGISYKIRRNYLSLMRMRGLLKEGK